MPAAAVQPLARPGANPASHGDEVCSTRPVFLFAASDDVFLDAILARKTGNQMLAVAAGAWDYVVAEGRIAGAVAPGPESQCSANCRRSMGPETKQHKNIKGLNELHFSSIATLAFKSYEVYFNQRADSSRDGPLYAYMPQSLA